MSEQSKILVVDDEQSVLEILSEILSQEGFQCTTSKNPEEALALLKRDTYHLVITDLKMPGKDGITLLREMKEYDPETCVILLTGHGSIETAVEAMKIGAYDYITKPEDFQRIRVVVERALEYVSLKRQLSQMQAEMRSRYSFARLVGKSEQMHKVYDLVERVAESEATVLIQGQSGTGKELLANAVHYNSHRSEGPFIKVDCGSLPESLLESELFGHEKGAFTGAIKQKKGRFELADGGTIFLDEIGNMSAPLQQRLLRVLQERQFERVGGTRTIKIDVRIIAATSKDLEQAVQAGTFREDLFYRLHVVVIELPPLRDRIEDVPVLAAHFLNTFAEQNNKNIRGISPEAFRLLMEYHWPGNVRELENTIEYAVVMCRDTIINANDLPTRIRTRKDITPSTYNLDENEKQLVEEVLEKTKYNIKRAAELLGISRTTLYSKIKKHGIQTPHK
ncbi:MAG: sigma-54-dependent Fis family transcriptional regulator [Gemmatimonadota bacterium]|nr:MAG: sigma-54-dependent Fis family transcriptional regulator [Gemmatimonadota bacterium]